MYPGLIWGPHFVQYVSTLIQPVSTVRSHYLKSQSVNKLNEVQDKIQLTGLSFPGTAAMEFHMKEGDFHVTEEVLTSFDK